jgi:xanthine dehydrogenase YagT iron-sulfur-binding subunit
MSVTELSTPLQATSADLNIPVRLKINGEPRTLSLDPRTTLLDALRDHLGLCGSKKGCDQGQCGACTVHINGQRVLSCLSLAVAHQQDEIATIEGLSANGDLHPMQQAFLECDAFQCGYCTPGQIMSAVAMLQEAEAQIPSHATKDVAHAPAAMDLDAEEIRERLSGNICRCGAYPNIVEAVRHVQSIRRGGK